MPPRLNRKVVAVHKKRGEFAKARQTLEKCSELMKAISAANPGDSAYMRKETLLLMDRADSDNNGEVTKEELEAAGGTCEVVDS